jgi:hypothetical protein
MAQQAQKTERWLKKRFLGYFKLVYAAPPYSYEKWKYAKTTEDDEWVFKITRIFVDNRNVTVDYAQKEDARGEIQKWIRDAIDGLINYGGSSYCIKVNPYNKAVAIHRSVREKFLGSNRYMNHDFVITNIRFNHFESKKNNSHYGFFGSKSITINPNDKLKFDVVFKMRNFRGDRRFVKHHIEKSILRYVENTFATDKIEVKVVLQPLK